MCAPPNPDLQAFHWLHQAQSDLLVVARWMPCVRGAAYALRGWEMPGGAAIRSPEAVAKKGWAYVEPVELPVVLRESMKMSDLDQLLTDGGVPAGRMRQVKTALAEAINNVAPEVDHLDAPPTLAPEQAIGWAKGWNALREKLGKLVA